MNRATRLILIFAVLLSGLVVVSFAAPPTIATAQSCTVVETFTAAGTTGGGATWSGTYPLIAGRRYTITLEGTGFRASDGWVFDPVYSSDNGWTLQYHDSGFRYSSNGQRALPTSYDAGHTYDIPVFGDGQPLLITNSFGATAGIVFSFDVSVCEDVQPYTTPFCTTVGTLSITSASTTSIGPTLTNGQTYDLYLAGEFENGSSPTSGLDSIADPYAYTFNGWSSNTFPYGNFNLVGVTSPTLITGSYQASTLYHLTVDGTGAAIEIRLGGGWFDYRGGFVAYVCDPSITPTPGPTGTPSPTPTPTTYPAPFSHRICTLLLDRAEFRNGWTFAGGADFGASDPDRFVDLPPGGTATLTLALQPTKKYGLAVLLRAVTPDTEGTVTLSIGTSAAYSIPIESNTDLRGFTTEAIQYQPDTTGGYTVKFTRPATDTGNTVIEYFCLQVKTDSTDEGNASSGSGESNDRCSTCVAPEWFGDIGGILNWLICQLKNLISCYISQFLIYIMGLINKVTGFALSIFIWMVDGFNAAVAWVNGIPAGIVRFFGGAASNTIAGASNGFHTSGIANGMNIVASGARDLPTTLYNIFNGLIGQVGSAIVQSGSLIEIILKLIVVAFSAIIFALFGLVPIIISSLLLGFFSPSNITSLSMTCTNPSSYLYYPCLIFYALDNTVLAGPAGYLFPIVMGLWAVQTFVWALNRVKEEISG